jgi:hypothetical protein
MPNEKFVSGLRKVLAYDEAVGKLHEAGLSENFVRAIEKDPELLKAIDKLSPDIGVAASPGWSCCVTVSNPLRTAGEEVVNPALRGHTERPKDA